MGRGSYNHEQGKEKRDKASLIQHNGISLDLHILEFVDQGLRTLAAPELVGMVSSEKDWDVSEILIKERASKESMALDTSSEDCTKRDPRLTEKIGSVEKPLASENGPTSFEGAMPRRQGNT